MYWNPPKPNQNIEKEENQRNRCTEIPQSQIKTSKKKKTNEIDVLESAKAKSKHRKRRKSTKSMRRNPPKPNKNIEKEENQRNRCTGIRQSKIKTSEKKKTGEIDVLESPKAKSKHRKRRKPVKSRIGTDFNE